MTLPGGGEHSGHDFPMITYSCGMEIRSYSDLITKSVVFVVGRQMGCRLPTYRRLRHLMVSDGAMQGVCNGNDPTNRNLITK